VSITVDAPPPNGRYRPRTHKYDWEGVRARLTEHPNEWVVALDEVAKSVVPWLRKEGPVVLGDIRGEIEYVLRDTRTSGTTLVGTLYGRYTPGTPAPPASAALLTDEQVREIRALRAAGRTLRSIAQEFGIHVTYVSRLVSGKSRPEAGGPGVERGQSPETVQAIREAAAAGGTARALGAQYGLSAQRISQITSGKSYEAAPGPVRGRDY